MRKRANGTTMLAAALLSGTLVATPLAAQSTDTTTHWSLFGGSAPVDDGGLTYIAHNVELGGSADFRLGRFPLPLRASLTFSQMQPRYGLSSALKFGTLSFDAVGHPLPKVLGAKLYLLGGLGVGTRAAYTESGLVPMNGDLTEFQTVARTRARQSWAFVEGGTGLELGHAFIQWKLQIPVASNGYVRAPV
ncbi:MAG TPA: hypothetical protein VFY85_06340, partial [Gemmatimonadaceae bacterium]|nr:hypothetical protein [Gemmatimonadaceae bacterium]